MDDWHHLDQFTVEKDGEEIEVYNELTLVKSYHLRSGSYESFTGTVGKGDNAHNERPEAITLDVAQMLDDIGVTLDDVDVINMRNDDVEMV